MRQTSAALTAIAVLTMFGCSVGDQGTSAPVTLVSESALIEFTFPAKWYPNPKDHPYDLQCFSPEQRMNTGVFAFRKIDLSPDSTPLEIFWVQVDDLKSKRSNVAEVEALQEHESGDTKVTTITYACDKDLSRFYYRFSLVEFKSDDSCFAVAIQVAFPSEWQQVKPILEQITRSARPLPDQAPAGENL